MYLQMQLKLYPEQDTSTIRVMERNPMFFEIQSLQFEAPATQDRIPAEQMDRYDVNIHAAIAAVIKDAAAKNRPKLEKFFSDHPVTASEAQFRAFRKMVYNHHIERSKKGTRTGPGVFIMSVDPGKLDSFVDAKPDGNGKAITLRREAITPMKNLLAAARAHFRNNSRKVKITVTSSYRDTNEQFDGWRRKFPNYYLLALMNGVITTELSNKNAALLAGDIAQKFGAPGYSNHQKGLAVDFTVYEGSNTFKVSFSKASRNNWKNNSLFLKWLQQHAHAFNFYPYEAEPWHWEYNRGVVPGETVGNAAPQKSRPMMAPSNGPTMMPVLQSILKTGNIFQAILYGISNGLNENTITDIILNYRHPDLGFRKLTASDRALIEEWKNIKKNQVDPALQRMRSGDTTARPAGIPVPASTSDTETTPPRRTIYASIKGISNRGKDLTGIYLPENFNAREYYDVILYFHGLRWDGKYGCRDFNFPTMREYWKNKGYLLREGLNSTGKNAVLVAPTLGSGSTSIGILKNDFSGFMQQVHAILKKENGITGDPFVRNIILAAHSGGGYAMNSILSQPAPLIRKIRECWCFDSLYFGVGPLVKWKKADAANQLVVRYHSARKYLDELRQAVSERDRKEITASAVGHCPTPMYYWKNLIAQSGFLG